MENPLRRLRSKRVWIAVPIAAALAVVATLGGVAQAHDGGKGDITARVAEILGVYEPTLEGAFSAAKELRADEAVQAWLDKLVEEGEITRDEADEFMAWYDERPNGVPHLRFSGRKFHKGNADISSEVAATLGINEQTVSDAISQAVSETRADKLQERLDKAVDDGRLTQEEADEISERMDSRDFRCKMGSSAGKSLKRGSGGRWGSGRSHWGRHAVSS